MEKMRRSEVRRPEGEGWLTTAQAAQILGVSQCRLSDREIAARLTRTRVGHWMWYRAESVEALARDPKRLRAWATHDRQAARRKTASLEGSSICRIGGKEAAWRLGVSETGLLALANQGKLTVYTEPGPKKHWYSWAEVEELRAARAERGVVAARIAQWETPQIEAEVTGRRRGRKSSSGRIGPNDLDEWERYLGDWLTVRQTAFLLNLSENSVRAMRKNGGLKGERRAGNYGKRRQWQFRKRDVEALLDDKDYMERRIHWEQHVSLAARKRKQAAAERAALQACAEANRRQAENGLCVRWLEVKW